jgi:SpoVK/Ycf46/Vps4 family AAA+-type ATPase
MTTEDLKLAMEYIGALCLCNASLLAPPDTKWDDITRNAGGAKRALREVIEWPCTQRQAFEALGLQPPRGVLLHGLPGYAKTMLVRATASAVGIAFLLLGPADVYKTLYIGNTKAGPRLVVLCMLECTQRCPPRRKRQSNGRWRRSTRWAPAMGKPHHLVPPHL